MKSLRFDKSFLFLSFTCFSFLSASCAHDIVYEKPKETFEEQRESIQKIVDNVYRQLEKPEEHFKASSPAPSKHAFEASSELEDPNSSTKLTQSARADAEVETQPQKDPIDESTAKVELKPDSKDQSDARPAERTGSHSAPIVMARSLTLVINASAVADQEKAESLALQPVVAGLKTTKASVASQKLWSSFEDSSERLSQSTATDSADKNASEDAQKSEKTSTDADSVAESKKPVVHIRDSSIKVQASSTDQTEAEDHKALEEGSVADISAAQSDEATQSSNERAENSELDNETPSLAQKEDLNPVEEVQLQAAVSSADEDSDDAVSVAHQKVESSDELTAPQQTAQLQAEESHQNSLKPTPVQDDRPAVEATQKKESPQKRQSDQKLYCNECLQKFDVHVERLESDLYIWKLNSISDISMVKEWINYVSQKTSTRVGKKWLIGQFDEALLVDAAVALSGVLKKYEQVGVTVYLNNNKSVSFLGKQTLDFKYQDLSEYFVRLECSTSCHILILNSMYQSVHSSELQYGQKYDIDDLFSIRVQNLKQ